MTHEEASQFLKPVRISEGEVWADLGAGTGTFTEVLAKSVGQIGRVHAVDRSKESLEQLSSLTQDFPVTLHHQDFSQDLNLANLDGILLANALHYSRRQKQVLSNLMPLLKPAGKLVVLEYDRQVPNPWIPFPVSKQKLVDLTRALKLCAPIILNERASRYGNGTLYLALIKRTQSSDVLL